MLLVLQIVVTESLFPLIYTGLELPRLQET